MRSRREPTLVSVHGGHSAQFCSHARDSLEEIVEAYVSQGFAWVGITEHMPAVSDELVPLEERAAGLDARAMRERFAEYVATGRALQERYAAHIGIYVGFETEMCTGYAPFVRRLVTEFAPDYLVGSVHHVRDLTIDASPELYAEAVAAAGGIDALYCAYFDQQYDLIATLRPAVVGHFDLVRLLDPEYPERLARPEISARITRNLREIRERGLILDFNLRALAKGQSEPYVSRPILEEARRMGIAAVPGDDSHGVDTVGLHCAEGVQVLRALGFDTEWRRPA